LVMKSLVKNMLMAAGFHVSRSTPRDELRSFFEKVRPQRSKTPLIRIGGDDDGGYLVPDDLAGVTACFSPGVAETADFEREMVARGIRCHLADYSVEKAPITHELVDFEKKFLTAENTGMSFTLASWVQAKEPGGRDFILQMDIEGGEYDVLLTADQELLSKFRVIVVEFHELNRLFDQSGFQLLKCAFAKLLRDFTVVHIHPNNHCDQYQQNGIAIPTVMEFTFLRNDRVSEQQPETAFPHPLDRKNMPEKPDLVLPRCWYDPKSI
jgi:hypothetical protein